MDVSEICSTIQPELSNFVHNIILLIKVAIPIVLVIFGMIDLGKGVIASKEDEIKKGQSTFIKRLIAAAVVFFMVAIVQLVTDIIDRQSSGEFWACANRIMNGTAGQEMTKNEKTEQENIIREQCCIEAGGTAVKGNDSVTCKDADQEKWNECFHDRNGY